jgi:alkylation response protein AidB-like acyl-CoA dehydrogenase
MFLSLTDEQQFLSEAAAGTLGRVDTVACARAALDGDPYVDLWGVAVEAGWPGLLLSEDNDGAGLGVYEAMLVLEQCGRRLADARLLGHLPATVLLERAGADPELLRALANGDRRAALVNGEGPELDVAGADVLVVATVDGADVLVDGADVTADGADVLVDGADVTADGADVLVDGADVTAAVVQALPAYDATRSLAKVDVSRAAGGSLGRDLQRALLAAESVGAADACLAMARAYALDRHAFGRAIGSYQAIKHKLVEMVRRIEDARSLLVGAGRAWAAADIDEFGLLANAARVAAAEALDYAAPENIFIHGGVGATWEHDAQLYYRRAELSRRLCGGVDAAADDVAERLFAKIQS